MSQFLHRDTTADVPWPTSDYSVRVPDAPTLPGSDEASPAAGGLMKSAVQGAHDTIDRIAESAAPAVRQLSESVVAAEEALHAKTNQLRETRDAWVEGVRGTVRENPLAAVATALALGAVIARLMRVRR